SVSAFSPTGGRKRPLSRMVILLFLGMLPALVATAQTARITGTVLDQHGNPLPGVGVVVKGTATGTATDAQGKYAIPAESSGVLQFSFLGYADREEAVGNRTVIDVTLSEDTQEIDEIVVVGYGTMRKVDLTGTVASVRNSDLVNVPVATAAEAITGKLAGVQVVTTSGEPDVEVKIRVRGGGSITQDNSPLFIIDGFPVDNGLSLVSPSDIERIDVLKDASSTAIYGARGANGVVIITTKSGREGRTMVNFDSYWGVKKVPNTLDMMTPYDFVVSAYERTRIDSNDLNSLEMQNFIQRYGQFETYADRYGNDSGTDWQKAMFRNAVTQNYNISVNGGNATTKYNIGLSRIVEEGALVGSHYNRTIMNAKLEHQANERLTVGFSARYNHNTTMGGSVSTQNALMYRPTEGLNGSLDFSEFDEEYLNENDLINPILLSEQQYRRKMNDNFNLMADAAYRLGNLVFKTQLGIDNYQQENRTCDGPYTKIARQNGGPQAILENQKTNR
ncbi:MAG: SusC/RagA family TonB-linked outer membrane protein, partial [Rikenellaceae bacterium]|nr:SusC/RagA family TonB-linked outer membrane protein [Rikenellaceae bacterium]